VVSVSPPGKALPYFRNSHVTAVACFVSVCGLRKPREADKTLIATAAVFMEFCECDRPGKPVLWRVQEGLQKLVASRGRTAVVNETVRHSGNAEERADFERFAAAIRDNRPVILTFCYDPDSRQGLAQARRRASKL
jgi:hypothetical protein